MGIVADLNQTSAVVIRVNTQIAARREAPCCASRPEIGNPLSLRQKPRVPQQIKEETERTRAAKGTLYSMRSPPALVDGGCKRM
ncbi:hypothetical protein NDU88_003191 [Pleurodeles waltl]|uniref:Uncharacterized protein n=1 Tax=Pleurodeles waltl TaxID=8319 RepID=A0AAV7UXR8_PLEWA|nr:hypothetical protein NDU88_003191 [Pleurodeles waltl]